MKLIVDSGSTKADWIAIDDLGKILFTAQTMGLNPEILEKHEILERILRIQLDAALGLRSYDRSGGLIDDGGVHRLCRETVEDDERYGRFPATAGCGDGLFEERSVVVAQPVSEELVRHRDLSRTVLNSF